MKVSWQLKCSGPMAYLSHPGYRRRETMYPKLQDQLRSDLRAVEQNFRDLGQNVVCSLWKNGWMVWSLLQKCLEPTDRVPSKSTSSCEPALLWTVRLGIKNQKESMIGVIAPMTRSSYRHEGCPKWSDSRILNC